jgi:methionyl aminopeptidase
MIPILNDEEMKIMKDNGRKLGEVMETILAKVKPGVSLLELEEVATKKIEELGGKPSFKKVPHYFWATCLNLNEGVVHGIPDETLIKEGDYLSVDVGFYSQGFHTDMAKTVRVKEPHFAEASRGKQENKRVEDKFLETGEKALAKAIEQVKPGNHVGHLSRAIERTIKKAGYYPVKRLTGHGVGRQLHQEPNIPCFVREDVKKTPLLAKGMVLAIEVIYTQGEPALFVADDGWTIRTQDGKIAGLFEKTVAVGANGPLILTKY